MKFNAKVCHSALVVLLSVVGVSATAQEKKNLAYDDEKHFKNIRQLTTGGDNAEAYFGFDNQHITFQRTNPAEGVNCSTSHEPSMVNGFYA